MGRKSHYGEGSVFERKDGRYEAVVPNFNGKRKSFYGKTKAEARRKRDEALAKLARGEYVETDRQKVGDYLLAWLEDHSLTIKITSRQSYRNSIKNHCIPHIGHIGLQKLTTHDIQRMYNKMLENGLKPKTVHTVHSALFTALNDAVKVGKLAKNPCQFVKLPRIKKREHMILDENQAQNLIQKARETQSEGHYIGTVVLLLIGTGMRIGELLALHWSEVDFEAKMLRIDGTISYDEARHILFESDPKTKTSQRTFPLPNLAMEALSAHRVNQIEQRLASPKWVEGDLLFANPRTKSGYMWPTVVRKHFYQFLQECGIPTGRAKGMVPHDLRHNVATALLAAGIPMKTVSEMLGHSDISITVNVYGHVTRKMQEQASNEIDRIWGN
jgi:integrase